MRYAIVLMSALCSAACSNYPANLPSIKPYKMDIQQGNVVTSKMMLQLRPGMTRSQVRFIMGTPLIADSFHANRWDYIYRMQKDGKLIEQRHVILDFENDKLVRVRGDVIPAGTGEAVAEDKPAEGKVITIAPKEKEKGLLDKLKFWKDEEPVEAVKPTESSETRAAEEPTVAEPAETDRPVATQAQPAMEPAATTPQKSAEEPAVEVQPELMAEPAPEPEAASSPESTSKAEPAAKAEPMQTVRPEAQQSQPSTTELKKIPEPEDDLPPEDDPGYFERMLEKIGF